MDPLGTIIPWIAACGALSLACATFFERLIPILPSYILLVTIGITAADGHWSVLTAFVVSVLGSVLGCLPFYALGFALGEDRSRSFLEWLARPVGVSTARFRSWVDRFQTREHTITLGAQLIPTVRLIAPGISGLLRAEFWRFLIATALGAALWNGIFIGVGYTAALATNDTNASVLALKTLVGLLLAEAIGVVAWQLLSQLRRTPVSRIGQDEQPDERNRAMASGSSVSAITRATHRSLSPRCWPDVARGGAPCAKTTIFDCQEFVMTTSLRPSPVTSAGSGRWASPGVP